VTPIARPACPRLWYGLALLLTAIVLVLSLIPSPPQPPGALGWDKAQHVLAYLALAVAWCQAIGGRSHPWVVLAVAALGCTVELLQGLGAARDPQFGDALANTIGATFGALLRASPAGWLLTWLDGRLANARPGDSSPER